MTTWLKCGECGKFVPDDADTCPACNKAFDPSVAKCGQCGGWVDLKSDRCTVCKVLFELQKPSGLGGLFGKRGVYRFTMPRAFPDMDG